MAIELTMPALSPTMEKGTLSKWLVAEGDMVKPGNAIAEIETDKATMEYEAVDNGRVASLLVPEGTDDVAVGTVIALLTEASDAAQQPPPEETVSLLAAPVEAMPSATIRPTSGQARHMNALQTTPPRLGVPPADRLKVSPLALRIAEAKGIDIGRITGTGPNGRIVRADIGIRPLVAPQTAAVVGAVAPISSDIAPPPDGVPVETVKLGSMRKTIARRLTESKQTVPHFYLTARCNLDPILRLRGELNASLAPRGIKFSLNDMLMKAMALALVEVPDANVQFGGDELYRFGRVDISMAVALDGGLVTPIIRDVASLSLSAIAEASKMLAAKARDGKLAPGDYQGGTASISNLGMFGIDEMFPVINPPQAMILGIGAGVEQPWKADGRLGLATIMAATGSFDHRAIDGAVAARFMAAFRRFIEEPMLILA